MEKYFVTYNQALALKELGFDELCLKLWEKTMLFTLLVDPSEFKKVVSERYTKAPLKSQVFEWFRKQGYDTKIHKEYAKVYLGFYWTGAAWEIVGNGSYEEAESACIDKLIEIVKNK